jgi:autotransporter family porin
VGFRPLSSSAATARVNRRAWEPRPQNAPYAHPPTPAELDYFHRWDGHTDDCGLRAHVDGDFSGTTDETMQWTAHKWGLDEDLVRAQMQAESTWDHAAAIARPGDGGQSFGLSQIKVTVHPGFIAAAPGDGGSAAHSLSLNADYYGYVMRAAMNGCEGWLAGYDATGHQYPPLDASDALWGAVGRWYSGEWWTGASGTYRATVQRHLTNRDWATAAWFHGAAGPWPG